VFRAGHAPGAAHLAAPEWTLHAAELPPREIAFLVVAEDAATASALVAGLRARGHRRAEVAPPEVAEDRRETGPARAVAWRPSAWLLHCRATLAPGARVLDVACGSGRDAVALAAAGARVVGIDHLPDALERARRLADRAAAPPHPPTFLVADATRTLPFRDGVFDLVTGFRYLDRTLFPRLVKCLAPGGELWWEMFSHEQARFGHPRRVEFLLGPGELPALCRAVGLEVVEARETMAPGGEGPALAAVRARLASVGRSR
jgi:SAM-dependent methyltransferase